MDAGFLAIMILTGLAAVFAVWRAREQVKREEAESAAKLQQQAG